MSAKETKRRLRSTVPFPTMKVKPMAYRSWMGKMIAPKPSVADLTPGMILGLDLMARAMDKGTGGPTSR